MRQFAGKVAVITGAASGIGRALAFRCAREAMQVVLADIERPALTTTRQELLTRGAEVHAVFVDVSKIAEVERLAQVTLDRFGAVHLLFNNAGVGLVGPRLWETTAVDWEWILGVNVRGVLHGVQIFLPIMLAQATEGHIVNSASAAGLMSPPGMGPYSASKAAVISISETLQRELAEQDSKIHVSVLCPGLVRTAMLEAARNRPATLDNDPRLEASRLARHADEEAELREAMAGSMSSDEVADRVLQAITEERFYVFTHAWVTEALKQKVSNALAGRAPEDGAGHQEPKG